MHDDGGQTVDGPPAPSEPRPASTVVLARDRDAGGLEVFLVQRHGKIGFMGGMHVFPGGKVSESDTSGRLRARVLDPESLGAHDVWGEGFGADDAFALAMAAIRETFEEAGVLLGEGVPEGPTRARIRDRLNRGEDFASLLEEIDARLRLSLLQPLSRWITPDTEPVRFDTAFYLARAPGAQHAEHDRQETVGGAWYSPTGALEAADAGEIRLAPPTSVTLDGLRQASSVDDAMRRARASTIQPILPLLRRIGDEMVVIYPGDPAHPLPERALPGPTRRVLRKL
jgi:8-oxo-dGTP pyrophosphatase MutT (NUDIX family)